MRGAPRYIRDTRIMAKGMRTGLLDLELEALREFKKAVDNAVTVAFLGMTDGLGATEPREAIEHIRREFRDAEMKLQQRIRVLNSGSN
jgi:hypothetical protein